MMSPSMHGHLIRACVGDGWRDAWLKRMEESRKFAAARPLSSAPRQLLEAGLGMRRLRCDRRVRCTPWAGGPTAFETGSFDCWRASADQKGADRTVGAPAPRRRRARPADRLPAGSAPLVGPLAKGNRYRNHGGATPSRMDARSGRARRPHTRYDQGGGSPSRLALAACRDPGASPRVSVGPQSRARGSSASTRDAGAASG